MLCSPAIGLNLPGFTRPLRPSSNPSPRKASLTISFFDSQLYLELVTQFNTCFCTVQY